MCNNTTGAFVNIKDRSYKTVKIGNQVWMAENLAYDELGSKYYENNSDYGKEYGKLYTWKMAKAICPSGWHLPSDYDWQTLVDFVGGEKIAGKKLKTTSGWINYVENGIEYPGKNGTDDFGFSAKPGGYCSPNAKLKFRWVGCDGRWWSSSSENTWGMVHHREGDSIRPKLNRVKGWFCSIRYVKD